MALRRNSTVVLLHPRQSDSRGFDRCCYSSIHAKRDAASNVVLARILNVRQRWDLRGIVGIWYTIDAVANETSPGSSQSRGIGQISMPNSIPTGSSLTGVAFIVISQYNLS